MTAEPLDDLDAAFTLPDVIEDQKLRALYEVLVHRMRAEAECLPMNTIQQLLIERIAYNYIVLRAKEKGELGGFAHSTVQKDYNTFWLSMTAEFNKMLGKTDVTPNDRKALLKDIQKLIVEVVNSIPDPKTRSDTFEKLAAAFEAAGI
jgi:hypothetical protein